MVTGKILDNEVVLDQVDLVEPIIAVNSNSGTIDTVLSHCVESGKTLGLGPDEVAQRVGELRCGLTSQPADSSKFPTDIGAQ